MELLTTEQVEAFARDGFLLLPDFYDAAREIEPIQRAVHAIFLEPTGIRIGWIGSFAAGKGINEVHPGLLIDWTK